jgi:hypothetical protein
MTGKDRSVDQIVEELLRQPLSKAERMRLLRELVRRGEDLPDAMLEDALHKLMDRLTE